MEEDCSTVEGGTDMLFRNVGNQRRAVSYSSKKTLSNG
jgi:hypothetical protein